jgi:DNA (cytosine-5)-methyltransferase 1
MSEADPVEIVSYGESARKNGIQYEIEVFNIFNNGIAALQQVNKYIPINLDTVRIELISNRKVNSITEKKTTSKSDIIIYNNDTPIPISLKMSNKGTQLQIISLQNFLQYLSYKNISCNNDVINVWKKFLGITVPNDDELNQLNTDRPDNNKNKKRYWLNELSVVEQLTIELFIYINQYALLEFCLRNGMCLEQPNQAELFLLNTESYTKTGNINFCILNFDDLMQKINIGKPMITKGGNIQLNKYVGIQRKGSGKLLSHKNSIQFKDRGFNNLFKVIPDNIYNQKKMKGLSLFACSGIAEYYLDGTDINIVLANELLQERCDIYKHFYPDAEIIQGDINEKLDDIISKSVKLGIDFIMATPPCQSFSNAGRKEIKDKRTPLFLTLINVIKEVKPKYVLIENVSAFMKSKYEEKNEETIKDKFDKELGDLYVINTKILDAKDYEVPQSRKRSITLLSLKTETEWIHPKKLPNIITVRDAIGHLPSLKSGESSEIHKWHKARNHNDNHIKWMSHTPTGQTAFKNIINFPQKDGRRIKGYNTTYKRIEWDKPSPTITMSSGSISSQNNVHPGNKYKKNRVVLYDNARALSVYEIMLLTGLDDNWDPPTNNEKLIRDIIGEAVPPKFLYNIIKNIPK